MAYIAQWLHSICSRESELHLNLLTETDSFISFPNLTRLSISNNKLENITSKMWTGLNSLSHLNVGHDGLINTAGRAFEELINLKTLRIKSSFSEITEGMGEGL